MSKYDPLWAYVQERNERTLKLGFDEVEKICSIPLDHSFLKCKRELTNYGYQVSKISMDDQVLMIEKMD